MRIVCGRAKTAFIKAPAQNQRAHPRAVGVKPEKGCDAACALGWHIASPWHTLTRVKPSHEVRLPHQLHQSKAQPTPITHGLRRLRAAPRVQRERSSDAALAHQTWGQWSPCPNIWCAASRQRSLLHSCDGGMGVALSLSASWSTVSESGRQREPRRMPGEPALATSSFKLK